MVGHPFNPVYLLPLVEIVGGEQTSPEAIERAKEIYASIGMKPVVIRKEIEAFVGDRLLEAVWREALWLIKDGISPSRSSTTSCVTGFGLRWAQMGMFQVYRIAGGEAGMRHFMAQFGPCLKWPWTKLMDVPEFNDELVDLIADPVGRPGSRACRSASWSGSATTIWSRSWTRCPSRTRARAGAPAALTRTIPSSCQAGAEEAAAPKVRRKAKAKPQEEQQEGLNGWISV